MALTLPFHNGTHTAFWIDHEYDRERASNEVSRFGAHIRQANSMAECWDGTWDDPQARQARFAEAAWATATPPVMSPGYVRRHRRVIRARVEFNAWSATLTGEVELVTPWLLPLAGSRDWGGARWRDWPTDSYGGVEYYREPGRDERTTHNHLLVSAALVFPLATDGLPRAPSGPRDAESAAREAIRVLVTAMNAVVIPVIETLERS